MTSTTPSYKPLVEACTDHGIGRTTAFALAKTGKLKTFLIGSRRYVWLESLATLPERVAPPPVVERGEK